MGGERASMMVIDRPYNVDYNPKWRNDLEWQQDNTAAGDKILNDTNFKWLKSFEIYLPDVIYIWCASQFIPTVQIFLEKLTCEWKYLIIWNKDLMVIGRGNYHWKHEPCLYMIRKGCKTNWQGDRKQATVWDIPTIHSFARGHNSDEWGLVGHGNQKPIECMLRPIKNNSATGDLIYDPFLGSGTTLIACEQLNRRCRGIEIDPGYAAVTLQRFLDLTSIQPELIK
jgi:DNA modification methylase